MSGSALGSHTCSPSPTAVRRTLGPTTSTSVSRDSPVVSPTFGRRTSMPKAVDVSGIVTDAEAPQPTPRISTLSPRRESTTMLPAAARSADATARPSPTTTATPIRLITAQRYVSVARCGNLDRMLGVERVDFVSVPIRDLDRARRFYGEVLGLRDRRHGGLPHGVLL